MHLAKPIKYAVYKTSVNNFSFIDKDETPAIVCQML